MRKAFAVAVLLLASAASAAPMSGTTVRPIGSDNGIGSPSDALYFTVTPDGNNTLLLVQPVTPAGGAKPVATMLGVVDGAGTTTPFTATPTGGAVVGNALPVVPLWSSNGTLLGMIIPSLTPTGIAAGSQVVIPAFPITGAGNLNTAVAVSGTPTWPGESPGGNAMLVRLVQPTLGTMGVYNNNGATINTLSATFFLAGGLGSDGKGGVLTFQYPNTSYGINNAAPNGGAGTGSGFLYTTGVTQLLIAGTGVNKTGPQTGTVFTGSGGGAGGVASHVDSIGSVATITATPLLADAVTGGTLIIPSGVNWIEVSLKGGVGRSRLGATVYAASATDGIDSSLNTAANGSMELAARYSGFSVTLEASTVTAIAGSTYTGKKRFDNLNIGPTGATLYAMPFFGTVQAEVVYGTGK